MLNGISQSDFVKCGVNGIALRFALGLFTVLSMLQHEAFSQQKSEFEVGEHGSMRYQFFKPDVDDPAAKLPLIVGLHGSGKRTANISKVLMDFHTLPAAREFQAQYPCYILAPKTTKSWFPKDVEKPNLTDEQLLELHPFWQKNYQETIEQLSKPPLGGLGELEDLFELIDKLVAENKIDKQRIYVVGFSMGGTGTWQAIAARPRFFAAAIPAAGGRLLPWQWSEELLSVPIWAFHGTADKATPIEMHRANFEYAKSHGGIMKLTEFDGAGHEIVPFIFTPSGQIKYENGSKTNLSSDACDQEENVWKWLFSKKLN